MPQPQPVGLQSGFNGPGLKSLQTLPPDLMKAALTVVASLTANPIQPPSTAPIDDQGKLYLYQQADPPLQINYQVDIDANRVIFMYFTSSEILKGCRRIVVAHSNQDATWLTKLLRFLKPLKDQQLAVFWHVDEIDAGANRADEISEQLDQADMVVLLVSQDYLNGAGVDAELTLDVMLRKAKEENLDLQWIPLSPSSWEDHEIKEYKPLRAVAKPHEYLSDVPDKEVDRELLNIKKSLQDLIRT